MDYTLDPQQNVRRQILFSTSTSSSEYDCRFSETDTEKSPCFADSRGRTPPIFTFEEGIWTSPNFCAPQHLPTLAEIIRFPEIVMTEDEIWCALTRHASDHFIFGRRVIRNMEIKKISTFSAFRCILQSFTEERSTQEAKKAYTGGVVDTKENGTPPDIWDIVLVPPKMFENSFKKSEVPHTASVKACENCNGLKISKCNACRGACKADCKSCRGEVKLFTIETCPKCKGKKLPSCKTCQGVGQINCNLCGGEGKIKYYMRLLTLWRNHHDDIIINGTELPDKYIRMVRGRSVFQETLFHVNPLKHLTGDVNEASRILLSRHKKAFPKERIIQQRLQVVQVPIAEVQYYRKGISRKLFVYGMEKEIYFPNKKMSKWFDCVIS